MLVSNSCSEPFGRELGVERRLSIKTRKEGLLTLVTYPRGLSEGLGTTFMEASTLFFPKAGEHHSYWQVAFSSRVEGVGEAEAT
jgi:hypothetical protein